MPNHNLEIAQVDGVRLERMKPDQRKAAVKRLEREGWKVWYQRQGGMWRMERETVVKEFGQAVTK